MSLGWKGDADGSDETRDDMGDVRVPLKASGHPQVLGIIL